MIDVEVHMMEEPPGC